jgi:LmbE family N-acetylglucosaminyl deacetylase
MLTSLHRRLTNPTFYLKWSRNATRPLRRVARANAPEPATDFDVPHRVDVYIAHPDDETFCSGLLCELVARGVEVHLNCLTRGEGGRTGGHSRADLAGVREAEMRAAASELGAASVDFLGFADPTPKRFRIYAPKVPRSELASLIARRLCRSASDWVITHGSSGEYWHPAHILLHRAVARAWASLQGLDPAAAARKPRLVTFNAWHEGSAMPLLLNRDDVPTLRLDVSAHAERRIRVMKAHQSQATLLQGWAGSFERYVEQANPEYYSMRTG